MNLSARVDSAYQLSHQWDARLLLFASAITLAVAYVVALHPATGMLGGFLIVLVGWAVPSVLNLLLATLVMSFCPRPLGKYPIALLLTGLSYWELDDSDPAVFAVAFSSLLSSDLNRLTGGTGVSWSANAERSVSVVGRANAADPTLEDVLIEISEDRNVTARLWMGAAPRYSPVLISSSRAPLSRNFTKIAWHDLTHGTFWSPLVGVWMGYYPRTAVRSFLRQAMDVG